MQMTIPELASVSKRVLMQNHSFKICSSYMSILMQIKLILYERVCTKFVLKRRKKVNFLAEWASQYVRDWMKPNLTKSASLEVELWRDDLISCAIK